MALFTFSAANGAGEIVAGEVTAETQEVAIKALAEQGLLVVRLAQKKQRSLRDLLGVGGRLKSEDLLAFTQQLSSMMNAAMPIPKALDIIGKDARDPLLRKVALDLARGVRGGTPLSDLLGEHPRVFSKFYISMVRAGEASGNLPKLLDRLATYVQDAEALKGKVIGALTYPLVILLFAVAVIVFIFIFGIPKFKEIYDGMGKELPPLTTLFLNAGGLVGNHLWLFLGLTLAVGFGVRWVLRFERTWLRIDAALLRMWLLGPLTQRLALARFARTLGTLLDSGVPMMQTLDLLAGATGNRVLEKAVRKAAADVSEGNGLADSLRGCPVFTELSISMVSAGEESGVLPTMMDKLADFYETQVDTSLKALTSIVEPVIMMGVGVVVALVILVLGLPLFNLATTLGG